MSDAVLTGRRCPNCEAPMSVSAVYCPRCMSRHGGRSEPAPGDFEAGLKTSADKNSVSAGTAASFSLTGLLLTITAIGVLLGIFVAAPGMGISLSLLMIPAWVRTAMVVKRREAMGYRTDAGSRVLLFVGSAFVTWAIMAVLTVSCTVTFCAVCLGGYALTSGGGGGGGGGSEFAWILISSGLTLVVVSVGIWLAWKIVRYRFRKDTDPQKFKR